MGWFDDGSDQAQAYDQVSHTLLEYDDAFTQSYTGQVVNAPHQATLSHELIAAAASYEVILHPLA